MLISIMKLEDLSRKPMQIVSLTLNKSRDQTMQISGIKFLKVMQIYLVELEEKLNNKESGLHSL